MIAHRMLRFIEDGRLIEALKCKNLKLFTMLDYNLFHFEIKSIQAIISNLSFLKMASTHLPKLKNEPVLSYLTVRRCR
jgi:hypothetical protein